MNFFSKKTPSPATKFAAEAHDRVRQNQNKRDQNVQNSIQTSRVNLYEEIKLLRSQQGKSVSQIKETFQGSGLPETLDTFFYRIIEQETSHKAKVEAAQVHRGLVGRATPEVLSEFLRNLRGLEGKKEFLRLWISQEGAKGRHIGREEGENLIRELLMLPREAEIHAASGTVRDISDKINEGPSLPLLPNGGTHIGGPSSNERPLFEEGGNHRSSSADQDSANEEAAGGEVIEEEDTSLQKFLSDNSQWAEWQEALADRSLYSPLPEGEEGAPVTDKAADGCLPDTPLDFYGENQVSKSFLISEAKKEALLDAAFNYGTPDFYRREKAPGATQSGGKSTPRRSPRSKASSSEQQPSGSGQDHSLPSEILSILARRGYWFEDDDSDYSGEEDEEKEDPSLSLNTVFISPRAKEYEQIDYGNF